MSKIAKTGLQQHLDTLKPQTNAVDTLVKTLRSLQDTLEQNFSNKFYPGKLAAAMPDYTWESQQQYTLAEMRHKAELAVADIAKEVAAHKIDAKNASIQATDAIRKAFWSGGSGHSFMADCFGIPKSEMTVHCGSIGADDHDWPIFNDRGKAHITRILNPIVSVIGDKDKTSAAFATLWKTQDDAFIAKFQKSESTRQQGFRNALKDIERETRKTLTTIEEHQGKDGRRSPIVPEHVKSRSASRNRA